MIAPMMYQWYLPQMPGGLVTVTSKEAVSKTWLGLPASAAVTCTSVSPWRELAGKSTEK